MHDRTYGAALVASIDALVLDDEDLMAMSMEPVHMPYTGPAPADMVVDIDEEGDSKECADAYI
jgi:hypothetical protein